MLLTCPISVSLFRAAILIALRDLTDVMHLRPAGRKAGTAGTVFDNVLSLIINRALWELSKKAAPPGALCRRL